MSPSDDDGSQHGFSGEKDEFGGFNSTSSGISHIFKEGRYGSSRTKILVGLIIVILLGFGGFYYYTGLEPGEQDFSVAEDEKDDDEDKSDEEETIAGEGIDAKKTDQKKDVDLLRKDNAAGKKGALPVEPARTAQAKAAPTKAGDEESETDDNSGVVARGKVSTVAPVISGPENGDARMYDETSKASEFTWKTDGGSWISFSQNANMKPIVHRAWVNGTKYKYRKLHAGQWFWQIVNDAGKSDIRSFTLLPEVKRKVVVLSPSEGSSLAGTGGSVSWSGDRLVSLYRVELSDSDWAKPNYLFQTSGTQLAIKDVKQGEYQMRVGAFSEVSGRWEYTQPIKVSVQ